MTPTHCSQSGNDAAKFWMLSIMGLSFRLGTSGRTGTLCSRRRTNSLVRCASTLYYTLNETSAVKDEAGRTNVEAR